MTDELGAVSVGLRVNMTGLNTDIENARRKVAGISGQHRVSFVVGPVDTEKAQADINRVMKKRFVITPTMTVTGESASNLRNDIAAKLKAQPVPVSVKLDEDSIPSFRAALETALAGIKVKVEPSGGGGAPAATTSRRARATTPTAAAVATPEAPGVASAPAAVSTATRRPARAARPAAAVAAPVPEPVEPTPVVAPSTTRPRRASRARAAAAPPPLGGAHPFDLRYLTPSGPAESLAARQSLQSGQTNFLGGGGAGPVERIKGRRVAGALPPSAIAVPGSRGAGRRLTKQAAERGRFGPDEMARQKARAVEPEEGALAPGELIGFGVPLSADELAEADAAGRGVRGASRSGARQRGERELTPDELLNIDTLQRRDLAENAARRDAEIRAPGRQRTAKTSFGTSYTTQNPAYYGDVSRFHPALRRRLAPKQFARIDPRLGQAFEAHEAGELGEARALLDRYFDTLAGPDPRKRRRFFKLVRNIEKGPPELVERYAAFGALMKDISIKGAEMQVGRAEAAVAAFPKPQGRQSEWPTEAVDEWRALLLQQKIAQQALSQTLQGVRPARQAIDPNKADFGDPTMIGGPRKGVTKATQDLASGRISRAEFEMKHPGVAAAEIPPIPLGPYPEPPPVWKPRPENELRSARTKLADLKVEIGAAARRRGVAPVFGESAEEKRLQSLIETLEGQITPKAAAPDTSAAFRDAMRKRLTGRAGGGRVRGIGSLSAVRRMAEQEQLYYRWTPDLARDMEPGRTSGALFNRERREAGVSATRVDPEWPGLGLNRQYDIGGKSTEGTAKWGDSVPRRRFAPRHAYLLSGTTVGEGWDGEPLLDPESITPIGRLSRRLMERGRALDEQERARRWAADPEAERARAIAIGEAMERGRRPRAGGGPVQGGGLLARMRAREAAERGQMYETGELKDELFVGDSGKVTIIPKGTGPTVFEESGKVEPFVPEWRKRAMAKDLTGRAPGGRVYGRPLPAEPHSGLGAPYRRTRGAFEGERAAIAAGQLSPSGGVQRVFVVNWPAAGFAGGAVVGAGGVRAASHRTVDAEADAFARRIGKELKSIIGSTARVKPTEPPAETPTPDAKLSAAEKLEAKLSARGGTTAQELRSQILAIRSSVGEVTQQIPVRSLAPAVGQITATVFGGRGEALARLNRARDLTDKATQAAGTYVGELEKLSKIEKQLDATEDPKKKAKLTEALNDQAEATELAAKNAAGYVKDAEAAAKAADSFGLKTKILAANTVGIIGGTLLFGATLGVAQAGIEAAGRVLGPAIERLTGYGNVSAKVTDQLSDQVRQQNGAVQSTIALSAAQAGLSRSAADLISPSIESRAEVEAGNKALKESIELLHTAEAVRRQNVGAPGGERGLTQYTGGLFGTGLLGTPGTAEQVANELAAVPSASRLAEPVRPAGPKLFGLFDVPLQSEEEALARREEEIAKGNDRLEFFNAQIEKGGESFRFVAQHSLGLDEATLAATREEAALAAETAGATHLASNIRSGQAILLDEFGLAVTEAKGFTEAIAAINKAFTTPDPELLIKALTERQIPAARAQARAESVIQRGVLPARFALGQLAAPTAGLRGGPAFEAGLVGTDVLTGKIDAGAQEAANKYRTLLGSAVSDVNGMIDEGRQSLLELVPSDLRGEFSALLGQIEATGQAISAIQVDLSQQQSNLAAAEYNNQLRIANRSLRDAKDLQAGISGETRNTLGGIEGQNVALSRQLQLLGFELQQRQINFRLATAGFVAPGTTPEERAARIEEAKKEAEFAQKQLDLQRQLAANQFKGVQITADRNVADLVAQIGLLEQGRTVQLNTAAANRALDILNKKQQTLVEKAGTYIEEGVKIVTAASQAASQVQAQTGQAFSFILGKTAAAWGIFGTQAKAILDALTGTAPAREQYGTVATGTGGRAQLASGLVFDTSGPTDITVGEAGKETVAVLRNPRQMSLPQLMASTKELAPGYVPGAGGGGTQITIIITGNRIDKDVDLSELADEITEKAAQKIEDRLQRRAALLNLRR